MYNTQGCVTEEHRDLGTIINLSRNLSITRKVKQTHRSFAPKKSLTPTEELIRTSKRRWHVLYHRTGLSTAQKRVRFTGAERWCPLLKGTELPEAFFQIFDFHILFPSLIIALQKALPLGWELQQWRSLLLLRKILVLYSLDIFGQEKNVDIRL